MAKTFAQAAQQAAARGDIVAIAAAGIDLVFDTVFVQNFPYLGLSFKGIGNQQFPVQCGEFR